jgi:hypothetical protein
MERWLSVQENMDQILFDAMSIEHEAFVIKAKEAYEFGIEGRAEGLFFSAYLTYHFTDDSGKTLLQKHLEKNPESPLNMIEESRFSVYEVRNYPAGVGLKDIFTRADFLLKSDEEMEEGDILVARLFKIGTDYFINDDYMIFPNTYKDAFVKGFMEKYNEYSRMNGIVDLEYFIKNQPLVLMKFVEILNGVEQESYEAEEDYTVYQTIYLVADTNAARNLLASDEAFDITLEESGFFVASLYSDKGTEDENLIAELILDGNRIEIEALDTFKQNLAKEKIGTLLGEIAVHFKDEVLSMDDLL